MFFLITTFVELIFTLQICCVASARPHDDGPEPTKNMDDDVVINPEKVENITLTATPPPPSGIDTFVAKFNRDNYYYPYKQELMAHVGFIIGFKDSSDSKNLVNPTLGFNYVLPREFSPKYETGSDLSIFTGRGHFWFMKRKIINEKGSFRPYYNYGIMHNFVPDERMASFSNSDNYLLRFGAGLENIIRPPRSADVEIEFAIGKQDLLVIFSYGSSWGF